MSDDDDDGQESLRIVTDVLDELRSGERGILTLLYVQYEVIEVIEDT